MNMTSRFSFLCLIVIVHTAGYPQGLPPKSFSDMKDVVQKLRETGLRNCESMVMLSELTSKAPHRLSGSRGADIAIDLTERMMKSHGVDNVHREPVDVPHWVRGDIEKASIIRSSQGHTIPIAICALGGSIATPPKGLVADVVEVRSFEELKALGEKAKGKIVFFNRPMDPTQLQTRDAYKGAVNQRNLGAIEAGKAGAVAVLVRSMTLALDRVPHTGTVNYADSVKKIPAAAVSTKDADLLSDLLKQEHGVSVRLKLSCQILPDVHSSNVIGEITGTEKPNEIIVVGAHLDDWDKGSGAHDDGAGCVQVIEALSLLKKLGIQPRRTIRAVLFMNEENGARGAKAYPAAQERKGESQIAAIESDHGGFAPRGFSAEGDSTIYEKVIVWKPIFELLNAGEFTKGNSGTDLQPLVERGVAGFGLEPETHRYFDYHHSEHDTIDKVNARELEMGAMAMALLSYILSRM